MAVQSCPEPNCAPACEQVAMPHGSSSEAPVMIPGPRIFRTFFRVLNTVTHTLLHAALTSDEFSNQKARAYEYSSGEYRTPVKKSVGQCFHLSLLDLGKAKRWYFQGRNGEAFSLPKRLLFWRDLFGMLSRKLIVPSEHLSHLFFLKICSIVPW